MRLTADLIERSISFINPLKERELDLRGHKIPTIENLGVAKDQDAIDFTDNDISILNNFPLSPRLRTLLLAQNRVSTIQPSLSESIPNLETLVLTSNALTQPGDLEPLGGFGKLEHLVLMDNPVTHHEHYRSYILHILPTLRYLDFQKISLTERTTSLTLLGTKTTPTDLAKSLSSSKSRSYELTSGKSGPEVKRGETGSSGFGGPGGMGGLMVKNKVQLNEEEKKRVKDLIRNAKSLNEISRLEKMLNEGKVPGEVLVEGGGGGDGGGGGGPDDMET